jgi:molybdopterin-containing oxidoreductase family membrane subunit
VEILTLLGSFGLFFTLFLLFIRWLPMVAMAEVKAIMPQARAHHHGPATAHAAPAAPGGGH